MAAPAQVNTLRATDFPKGLADKASADKLFQILNPFLQQVQSVTTAGTSLGQNVDGQLVTMQVTTPADDWITPTLQNAWVNFGLPHQTARWRVTDAGQIEVQGMVKSGALSTAIFTDSRAASDNTLSWMAEGGDAVARLQMDSTGTLQPVFGGTVGTFLAINVVYTPSVANRVKPPLSCFPVSVRLKDGKKPSFVVAQASPAAGQFVSILPSYTVLGTGPTGNQLRIDNIPGLALGTKYQVNLFIFF